MNPRKFPHKGQSAVTALLIAAACNAALASQQSGIIHESDVERLELHQQDPLFVIEKVRTRLGNGVTIEDLARKGDTIVFHGRGFSDDHKDHTVIFYADPPSGPTYNQTPVAGNRGRLEVHVPSHWDIQYDDARMSVVTRGQRSNTVGIDIVPAQHPILYPVESADPLIIGEQARFYGEGFSEDMQVRFGSSVLAEPVSFSEGKLTVIVPKNHECSWACSHIRVESNHGASNQITQPIARTVEATLQIPAELDIRPSDLKILGMEGANEVLAEGTSIPRVVVAHKRGTSVQAVFNKDNLDNPVILSAHAYPRQSSVTLSPESTAMDQVLGETDLERGLAPDSIPKATKAIRKLEGIKALEAMIRHRLGSGDYGTGKAGSDYNDLVQRTRKAAMDLLRSRVNDGKLTTLDEYRERN